jgi:AmiR/NasT family two-component response regulator
MIRSIRIAVADDEPRMRDYYREILPLLGHQVTCAAQTGRELVRACQDARPELVITDIKMPELDGIDAISEIGRVDPIPAILVSAYHDPSLIERTRGEQILAYIVKPIKQADLEVAIGLAMQRFEQFQTLRKETGELRQALADRKVIERAKGILMKRSGLDEEGAFRRLQKLARDHNQRLIDAAHLILKAEEAFQPPEP